MIGLPRDATILDRSIRVTLQRKRHGDTCEPFTSTEPYPELRDLARKAARWALDHIDMIRTARPALPAGFANRLADNWRPLLALADEAGGPWPKRAREAAAAIGEPPDADLGTALLADVREVLGDDSHIYTGALVEGLLALAERPWSGLRRGKGIDAAWLARTLDPFELRSERIRNGDARQRGYTREALEPVFARYLHPLPPVEAVPAVPASHSPGQRDGRDGPTAPEGGYAEPEPAAGDPAEEPLPW
jgi:hypothetical protein